MCVPVVAIIIIGLLVMLLIKIHLKKEASKMQELDEFETTETFGINLTVSKFEEELFAEDFNEEKSLIKYDFYSKLQ